MRRVVLTLVPEEGAFNAVDGVIADDEAVEREAILDIDWLSDGSSLVLYRLSGEGGVLLESLAAHDGVLEYQVTDRDDDRFYLFLHTDAGQPLADLLALVEDNAILIDRPIEFTDRGISVTVAGEPGALRKAFAGIPDEVDARVHETGEYVPGESRILGSITDRQREALEAAIDAGYYELPRQGTAEDVAARLECSPSTASELLRRAEAAIVTGLLSS